mgnify:CR=1 FL=1
MDLTIDTIKRAQQGDNAAFEDVLNALQPMLVCLAREASRLAGGSDYAEQAEYLQSARIAVWEALPRFTKDTPEDFTRFIRATVSGVLRGEAWEVRHQGSDRDAVAIFKKMLDIADGDEMLAERLCQIVPPPGKRLSADRARAARLAWRPRVSLSVLPEREEPVAHSIFTDGADVDADELARTKRRLVHAILESMGARQRDVLRYSFGIDAPYYGHGDAGHDDELADVLSCTIRQVRDARTKGLKAFAKRYIPVVADGNSQLAEELRAAADKQLSRGGRK